MFYLNGMIIYMSVCELDNNLKHISKEEKAKIFMKYKLKAVSAHENVTHSYESLKQKDTFYIFIRILLRQH